MRQLRESASVDVWHKCAGCLMVLCANSEANKRLVGDEMGVPALVDVLRKAPATSLPVLKAALGALAVLSSDERNLQRMRAEGMEQQVDRFVKSKDPRIAMFVKQLSGRLFNESEV